MRMLPNSLVLVVLVASLAGPTPVTAQERKGSINGVARDSGHAVLKGAAVNLQPAQMSAVTDSQGQFTISDLAPGEYILTISYVGLDPFSKKVTVTAGQATLVNAELRVAGHRESITVTAERPHGEAEAINRERTAANILQVLPYDVIASLPNANVADAIGRLPSVTLERDVGEGKYLQIRGTEPRFTNVTIDGISIPAPETGVRQTRLDTIPSDMVESVEINKTLQANMDADGIGGSANLKTKTAGEQATVSLFGLGGYTPILNGRASDQFAGTIGKRFGNKKQLGVLFGSSYDWNGRGIDDIEPVPIAIQCSPSNCQTPSANAPFYATFNTMDLRENRYYRTRYGFTGSVDYKRSDTSNFWARGLYSHFDNFGDLWTLTPTINSFTTSPSQGGTDGSMSYKAAWRRPVLVIGSMAAGSRLVFPSSWLTWEVSASQSYSEDHGYSTAQFAPVDPNSPLNHVQFLLNDSNPNRPKFVVQNGVNIYDATGYFLQSLDISRTYGPQVGLSAAASFDKQYQLAGHYATFEIGGKVRNAHEFQDFKDPVYTAINPSMFPLSSFPISLYNNHFYDGSYTPGPLIDYSKVIGLTNSNPSAFTVDYQTLAALQGNFDLIERIGAGYVMNTINFSRFRLYTGLRFETTTESTAGYQVTINPNGGFTSSLLHETSTIVDPLPSAELRYALTPDSAIRVAYGRGIARANFGDLAPTTTVDYSASRTSVGNPYLKATHANNYDILYEHYLKPVGMIECGFFYKNITDPIYSIQSIVASGPYTGFRQTQPQNGSSAYVWGFEASYQQHLGFLPGKLSGVGISANYSYTASSANGVPNRTDHPPLQRQAPNTWNISPTYDRGRLSMRVGMTYNQANIFAYNYTDGAPLGVNGPLGDVYLYSHLQVDAQGSYRLTKRFTAVVSGLNVTNEVFGFYQGHPIYPIQREYYKPTISAGIRWTSSPEIK